MPLLTHPREADACTSNKPSMRVAAVGGGLAIAPLILLAGLVARPQGLMLGAFEYHLQFSHAPTYYCYRLPDPKWSSTLRLGIVQMDVTCWKR